MPPSAQNPGLPVNPVDVTGVNFVDPAGGQSLDAMWGVISLSNQAFPSDTNLSGNGDYLLARLDLTAATQAVEDLRDWPGERFGHRALLERAWEFILEAEAQPSTNGGPHA